MLFGLAACGNNPDAATAALERESGMETIGPVEVRLVSDDPAVRQRITPPQILAYFPETVGDLPPSARTVRLADEARDNGSSHADATYMNPGFSEARIVVAVTDWVDSPGEAERQRGQVETGEGLDPYGSGEVSDARSLEGGVGRSVSSEPPSLHVILANRFIIVLRAEDSVTTEEDLWAAYDASGLARLAGAGVYGEPGGPEPPAWAADPIAAWSPPESSDTPPEPVASSTALPSCDVLLPVAEVRRVCEIPELRARATPFETEGKNCNRTYNRGREISGLIFIVSRFSNEGVARSAQQASMDFPDQLDHRDVSGLGDAATRVVHDLSSSGEQKHILSVASGVDVLEFKSGDYDVERGQQVCTLEQMETLARGVVERLNADAP